VSESQNSKKAKLTRGWLTMSRLKNLMAGEDFNLEGGREGKVQKATAYTKFSNEASEISKKKEKKP